MPDQMMPVDDDELDVRPRTDAPAAEDHLPPVEPPSAGFIVQLFLVPAIIVAIVIGVYLLFGRIAASETDWRQLVSDIQNDKPNIRVRAAMALAEALNAEEAGGASERPLAGNVEIATALNDLTLDLLRSGSLDDERQQQLQFLLKALGRMDAAEAVWPALREALSPTQESEVRKYALQAVAMIAGRRRERNEVLDIPGLIEELIAAAQDTEPVLRQHAAFALGLIPGSESETQLERLLEDPDAMTRLNAAIAFAREHSPRGLRTFESALKATEEWARSGDGESDSSRAFEQQVILINTLRALSLLAPNLGAGDMADLTQKLRTLEENLTDTALRLQVKATRLDLEAAAH